MKISLAELILVLQDKKVKLNDLFYAREDCKYNIYKKASDKELIKKELMHEPHEKTMREVQEEIEGVEKEIRILTISRDKANIETYIDFTIDNSKITLREAILYIMQLRISLEDIKTFSSLKTTSQIVDPTPYGKQNSIDRSFEQTKEPSFDTKKMKEKYVKMTRIVTKLELAISKANCNTEIEVPLALDLE